MKKFYIGSRHNPQFDKPYYIAYGQLLKKEAKKKENAAYGSIYLTSYDSKEEYEAKIKELKENGYRVSTW